MKYTVLLIVLPLLLGFLSMIFKEQKKFLLYAGITINIILLFVIGKGTYFIGGFDAPYGISLVLDQYSYIGVILINTLFFFSVVSNYKLVDKYSTVILTLLAGVNGMILTGDLFNLFVFLEITTISAYVITTESKKFIHTFNYLILGSIGSGIYLLGVIIMYASFGTLNLNDLAIKVSDSGINLLLPLLLIFIGLSVEAKLVPFSGWVKGIYKNANGLVGSLMASVVASATLLVFGRILNSLFIGSDVISTIVLIMAIITLISGEALAFNGKSIKEILLFSSIGQSGLITILMITGLIFPAMLLLINNAISKLIMFTVAHEISESDENFENLKGIFTKHKILGLGFLTASFSIIGLPLFLGFYAKINSLIGLMEINMLIPLFILLVTIVEGAYLIRLNITLWYPGKEGESVYTIKKEDKKTTNMNMTATVFILTVVIVVVGLMPNILGDNLIKDELLHENSINYLTDLKGGM